MAAALIPSPPRGSSPGESDRRGKRPPGRWSACRVVLAILVAVILAGMLAVTVFRAPILRSLGRYLVVADAPAPSDVAVALGGGRGQREMEAARLYRAGTVQRIIVTGGSLELPGRELTWCGLMARHLSGEVPDSLIWQEPRSSSTYEDAIFVLEDLRRMGAGSAIVVTDPYHLRRTRATFHRIFAGSGIRLLFVAPTDAWFRTDTWWTREDGLLVVVQEFTKMLFYVYSYRIWPWT